VAELKTKATNSSVKQFLDGIKDDGRRKDCEAIVTMMTKATKAKPVMWGTAIIGFGDYEYAGANGKANKWFKVGFSPRKAALSLYLMGGKDAKLLAKLGAASGGGTTMAAGCLYIKRLEDVDQTTLQKLIDDSVKRIDKLAKQKNAK